MDCEQQTSAQGSTESSRFGPTTGYSAVCANGTVDLDLTDMNMLQLQETPCTEDDEMPNSPRRKRSRLGSYLCVSLVCVAATLLATLLATVLVVNQGRLWSQTSTSSTSVSTYDAPETAALITRRSVRDFYPDADDGLDLRINPGKECHGPYCRSCKATVMGTDYTSNKRYSHCPGTKLDVQRKYQSCGADFYWLLETASYDTVSCGGIFKKQISCCEMAHLCPSDYCNGGECVCDGHSGLAPSCKCPPGQTGKHCEKRNTQTVKCKCYQTTYKLCGEGSMPECSDSLKAGWTTCHTAYSVNGVNHNCQCEPVFDGSEVELDDCSVPTTGRHKFNGIRRHL